MKKIKDENIEDEAAGLMAGEGKLLILPEFRKFDLNIRQAKFAQMKAYGYSNTESARAAGYSKAYAYQIGYSLMAHPKVAEYIKYLQANVAYTYGISKNMLIEELMDIKKEARKDNKLQIAITAIKAIANITGLDNGKNPEVDTKLDSAPDTVQNFQINFTNSLPEEKKKLLAESDMHQSLDFKVLDNFIEDIIDETKEKIIKKVEGDLSAE